MSEWAMKRFWTEVSFQPEGDRFAVKLDGRSVKTPAKAALLVPTEAMAERIAEEWDAQAEAVDPARMPWTRSANAAIDKVATQRIEVEDHLAGYAGSDLLCYRAEGPDSLVARQQEVWDPVLDWLATRYDVRLSVGIGVMPVEQSADNIARLASAMTPMSDFQLTGFYDLVTLSGSFGLALAVVNDLQPVADLWAASRLDETWQIEQWGDDEEAAEVAAIKERAFLHAAEVFRAG